MLTVSQTNDDGPPSAQSSPYILPFVQFLEKAGHTVSVIVPDVQRSWIGKAHMVGLDVQATSYWPPETTPEVHAAGVDGPPETNGMNGVNGEKDEKQPWVLVNSTPATCAQIGISHFFSERGPIDLVVSGPNYGRNTTAVFALSSGTLGAALEASICGYRSIALSFAFFDRKNDPDIVAEACQHAVRVCEGLSKHASWDGSQLYSVNVPVSRGVSQSRVVWTRMLQNQWKKGACFQELPSSNAVDGSVPEEAKLRRQENGVGKACSGTATPSASGWRQRHFKWAPRFTDVFESVERAGPGIDGWAVKEGETSVTALRANFMHVEGMEGEVKL